MAMLELERDRSTRQLSPMCRRQAAVEADILSAVDSADYFNKAKPYCSNFGLET
jgi:hypothetical protein